MAGTKQSITVDGVKYVREGSQAPRNSKIKIVILQRGWVMVGRWSQEGETCSLDDAAVIRTWGTTRGLGQLALEGKQSGTRLDPVGHVDFHQLTVVAALNCKEDLWDKELV